MTQDRVSWKADNFAGNWGRPWGGFKRFDSGDGREVRLNAQMAPVKPTDNWLFVFGTLRSADTRNWVMDRDYDAPIYTALLPGFTKVGGLMIDRGDNPGDAVSGLLLTGISDRDMMNLDDYESIRPSGFGGYARAIVPIFYVSDNGEILAAKVHAYIRSGRYQIGAAADTIRYDQDVQANAFPINRLADGIPNDALTTMFDRLWNPNHPANGDFGGGWDDEW